MATPLPFFYPHQQNRHDYAVHRHTINTTIHTAYSPQPNVPHPHPFHISKTAREF